MIKRLAYMTVAGFVVPVAIVMGSCFGIWTAGKIWPKKSKNPLAPVYQVADTATMWKP